MRDLRAWLRAARRWFCLMRLRAESVLAMGGCGTRHDMFGRLGARLWRR
jgi:hypothetical protein